jgi:hypothetical protein
MKPDDAYMKISVLFNYTNPAPSDHRKPRENKQKSRKVGLLAPPRSCWFPGSSWLPNKNEIIIYEAVHPNKTV